MLVGTGDETLQRATHVDAFVERFRDPGSTPGASKRGKSRWVRPAALFVGGEAVRAVAGSARQ